MFDDEKTVKLYKNKVWIYDYLTALSVVAMLIGLFIFMGEL